MRKSVQSIVALVVLLCVTGCTMRLVDFTIISTKNIDLARASTFERGDDRVEGKDSINIIIFIPTGVPNVKQAIDSAIESVPGAVALVDGVVSYSYFYIPYIFGQQSYIVEGTPLIDPQLAAGKLKSNYIYAKLDKNGQVKQLSYVSQKEYMKLHKKVAARGEKISL